MKIGNFYKWVDEDWTFLATDSLIFSIFINEYITFDIYIFLCSLFLCHRLHLLPKRFAESKSFIGRNID